MMLKRINKFEKRIQHLEVQQKALLILFLFILACFLFYTFNHEKTHKALVEFNGQIVEFSDKISEILLIFDERILELEVKNENSNDT